MKAITKTVAGAVAAFMLVGSAVAAEKITVEKGTDVKLRFAQKLNSKTAKVGDRVKLEVDENLVVDGRTVLKEGTVVWGKIEKVKKRDRFGVNAEIKLTLMNVNSRFGKAIPLEPKREGERVDGERTGGAAAASLGGAALLGPLGLIGGYFVVGKSVDVKEGDKITAQVAKDVVINA